MYYRSMRREVYVLAREYGYGYVIVHVMAPLEVITYRNALRPHTSRISDDVSIYVSKFILMISLL